MDRATKVIKRSSIRLKAHSNLNMILNDLSDIRAIEKSSIKAYQVFIEDLVKWSLQDNDETIKYLFSLLADLNMLWTGIHCEFLENLKHLKYQFDMILESEQVIDKAKDNLLNCEHYKLKLSKELKKATKKSVHENTADIMTKLNDAEKSVDDAKKDVTEKVNENEVIKVIRLKTGMMKLTEALLALFHKCSVILLAQKEVISEIPDLSDNVQHQRQQDDAYFDSDKAKRAVIQAKEDIQTFNICTSKLSKIHVGPREYEAPPPYSPFTNQSSAYPQPFRHASSSSSSSSSFFAPSPNPYNNMHPSASYSHYPAQQVISPPMVGPPCSGSSFPCQYYNHGNSSLPPLPTQNSTNCNNSTVSPSYSFDPSSTSNCSEYTAVPMTYICCKCSTKFTSTHTYKRLKGKDHNSAGNSELTARFSGININ